jgi:hypothetical protein
MAEHVFENGHYWVITLELRWAYGGDDNDPELQQKWQRGDGMEERWVTIPSVRLLTLSKDDLDG